MVTQFCRYPLLPSLVQPQCGHCVCFLEAPKAPEERSENIVLSPCRNTAIDVFIGVLEA